MLAQKLIRQRQGSGIVFEIGKDLRLALCVFSPAQLPIDQHQIVVGSEILWIDRQDLTKAFKRTLVITLDLTELAELLKRYTIPGESRQHLSDITLGLVQPAALHEDSRLLKQSPHVCRIALHDRVENLCRFVILFKLDVRQRPINLRHRTILFVEFGSMSESVDRQRILSLVE